MKKFYIGFGVVILIAVIIILTWNSKAEAVSLNSWEVSATSETARLTEYSVENLQNLAVNTDVEIGIDNKNFFLITNSNDVVFSKDEKTDSFDSVVGAWVQPINQKDFSVRCGILQRLSFADKSFDFEEGNAFKCKVGKLY